MAQLRLVSVKCAWISLFPNALINFICIAIEASILDDAKRTAQNFVRQMARDAGADNNTALNHGLKLLRPENSKHISLVLSAGFANGAQVLSRRPRTKRANSEKG